MKLQSKSLILENFVQEIDNQLAAIPSNDYDGSPIEDSMNLDMYVDGVANINFIDGIGRKHYPIDKTLATILVEDELKERKNQPTEEDKYGG